MSVTVQAAHGGHIHFSGAEIKAFIDAISRDLAQLGSLLCHGERIDFGKIERQP